MAIKDILYKIDCESVKIAKRIEPAYRPNVTQGIPDLYTFKARPPYRKPAAKELRAKVALILSAKRREERATQ